MLSCFMQLAPESCPSKHNLSLQLEQTKLLGYSVMTSHHVVVNKEWSSLIYRVFIKGSVLLSHATPSHNHDIILKRLGNRNGQWLVL